MFELSSNQCLVYEYRTELADCLVCLLRERTPVTIPLLQCRPKSDTKFHPGEISCAYDLKPRRRQNNWQLLQTIWSWILFNRVCRLRRGGRSVPGGKIHGIGKSTLPTKNISINCHQCQQLETESNHAVIEIVPDMRSAEIRSRY